MSNKYRYFGNLDPSLGNLNLEKEGGVKPPPPGPPHPYPPRGSRCGVIFYFIIICTVWYNVLFIFPDISSSINIYLYIKAYPAKLIYYYLNFQPLEVVSRCRDPQPQVAENYRYLLNLRPNIYKSWCLNNHFTPNKSGLLSKNGLKTTIVVIRRQRVNMAH